MILPKIAAVVAAVVYKALSLVKPFAFSFCFCFCVWRFDVCFMPGADGIQEGGFGLLREDGCFCHFTTSTECVEAVNLNHGKYV